MAGPRFPSVLPWRWAGVGIVVGIGGAAVLVARGADGAALVVLLVAAAASAVWLLADVRLTTRRSRAARARIGIRELPERLDLAALAATACSGRRQAVPEAARMVQERYPELTPPDATAVLHLALPDL